MTGTDTVLETGIEEIGMMIMTMIIGTEEITEGEIDMMTTMETTDTGMIDMEIYTVLPTVGLIVQHTLEVISGELIDILSMNFQEPGIIDGEIPLLMLNMMDL